jgi:hypothetical protein
MKHCEKIAKKYLAMMHSPMPNFGSFGAGRLVMNIKQQFVTAAGLSKHAAWMLRGGQNSITAHLQIAMQACELRGAELHIKMTGNDKHVQIIGNNGNGLYDVCSVFKNLSGLPSALIHAVDMMVQLQPYTKNNNVVEFKRNG